MEAKKSLGQHFLVDESVLLKIKNEVEDAENIIEIGPGRGALTRYLTELNASLSVVEFDKDLIEYLEGEFLRYGVKVYNEDAKNFALREKATIVGNLPYNVSKRIIKNMILQKDRVDKMVFMVQKEVADSIVARENTHKYSKFSVFVQLFFKVKRLFNVQKGAFNPPPKVESSVVEFLPYKTNLLNEKIESGFFEFLNVFFAHPRKTLKNNLKSLSEKCELNGEFLSKRPREFPVKDIYSIYKGVYSNE